MVRGEIFIITFSNKKTHKTVHRSHLSSNQFTINEGYKLTIKLYRTTLELSSEYSFIPYTHTSTPTIFLHQSWDHTLFYSPSSCHTVDHCFDNDSFLTLPPQIFPAGWSLLYIFSIAVHIFRIAPSFTSLCGGIGLAIVVEPLPSTVSLSSGSLEFTSSFIFILYECSYSFSSLSIAACA